MEGYDSPAEAESPIAGVGVPAVVAVVTTRDAGPGFDDLLASIASQEYNNLVTLVIDAGSEVDPTERVADVLPSAFVKRIDDRSFAAAANAALGTVDGASFYLFLHDDVVLGRGAVQAMVEEAFRSNAGIVGAKLLDGTDHTKLTDVGSAIDKFGFIWPFAESGELDQSQHDAIREAFVVSGAAMLVRCDLFRDLGGFSTDIAGSGEELDLCWRARVAGARTVVMPAAKVVHHGTSSFDEVHERSEHLALRHQARVMLACYSLSSLLRILPQAIVLGIADLFTALLRGRWRQAKDVFMAFVWNVAHLPTTLKVRRATQKSRRSSDEEIRKLQIKGSARFTNFFHEYTSRDRSLTQAVAAAARGTGNSGNESTGLWGLGAFLVCAVIIVFGSRTLIGGSVPVVREFVPTASAGELLREWWSGWRSAGLGQAGGTPTVNLVAGVLTAITFGSTGLVRLILFIGPLALGALYAWRLLRGIASPAARIAVLVAYLANPIPYNAIAEGRWQALVIWAFAPAILYRLAVAGGFEPFAAEGASDRPVLEQIFGLGLVVAIASTVAPVVSLVVLAFAALIAVVVGAKNQGNLARLGAVAGGSLVVSAVVHLPWTIEVLTGSNRLEVLLGNTAGRGAAVATSRAVLFDTGSHGNYPTLGLLVVIGAAVIISVGPVFRWAMFALASAVTSFALIALAGALSPSGALPVPEVILVPAALGAALAAGIAVESMRTTLAGSNFGLRHLAAGFAIVGIVVSAVPLVVDMLDGRWAAPTSDVDIALGALETGAEPENFRTLWIGDSDALSQQGWEFDDGMKFVVSTGVESGFSSLYPSAEGAGEKRLAELLSAVQDGDTSRLGSALAEFGIKYVIVQERLAPLPYGKTVYPIDANLKERLRQQFDLSQVDVAPGIQVYENLAAVPVWSSSETQVADGTTLSGLLGGALSPLDVSGTLPTTYRAQVPADQTMVLLSELGDGWSLQIGSNSSELKRLGDWASVASTGDGGDAVLTYSTPISQVILHIIQLIALAVVLVNRRGRRWWIGRARPHDPAMAELLDAEELS